MESFIWNYFELAVRKMYAGVRCINISVRKLTVDKLDRIKNAVFKAAIFKCAIPENRFGKVTVFLPFFR